MSDTDLGYGATRWKRMRSLSASATLVLVQPEMKHKPSSVHYEINHKQPSVPSQSQIQATLFSIPVTQSQCGCYAMPECGTEIANGGAGYRGENCSIELPMGALPPHALAMRCPVLT
eukprot:847238-Rhodomonas_salina.1